MGGHFCDMKIVHFSLIFFLVLNYEKFYFILFYSFIRFLLLPSYDNFLKLKLISSLGEIWKTTSKKEVRVGIDFCN